MTQHGKKLIQPFSHETAVAFMEAARGKTFDPAVLEAFFSIEQSIQAIAAKYRDDNKLVLGDHDFDYRIAAAEPS